MPCVGLVSLEEYLHELKDFNVETYDRHQYRELHSRGLIVPKFARCARPPHR